MATTALDKDQNSTPMRIKLNRRGWVVLVGIPVFLLTLAATLFVTMFSNSVMASVQQPTGVEAVEVTVLPGDTLWGLASEFSEGYDMESAVRQIAELNSLEGSTLQAGQTLYIPVAE